MSMVKGQFEIVCWASCNCIVLRFGVVIRKKRGSRAAFPNFTLSGRPFKPPRYRQPLLYSEENIAAASERLLQLSL